MLNLTGISKSFGAHRVLADVALDLSAGEIGALLGPSGCGKTTLLRIIAGFERPDHGEIFLDSEKIPVHRHPSQRSIGFLFQNYALFPHLSAKENVLISLRALDTKTRAHRLNEVLSLCGLENEASKYPHQLSGGQQQRLALARALAPRPKLLLMDEPFSSLDPELRNRLSLDVRTLLKSQNMTCLLVTHQIEEAYDLADRVGILNKGSIAQWTTPFELYHSPRTEFVARYTEQTSSLDVVIGDDGSLLFGSHRIDSNWRHDLSPGSRLQIFIRPHDIAPDSSSTLQARVCSRHFRGSRFLYELECNGHKLHAYFPSQRLYETGHMIGIRISIEKPIAITGS